MFSKILYATDGSDNARRALDVVADLSRRYGAAVIVLTAFEPMPRDLGSPYFQDLMNRRTAEAQALAREATSALEELGLANSVEILEGPPAQAILEVARTQHCELIVMGSRGLGRLGSALLGSVSLRVVQEAPCPVLIVR
jgi:nucleotide-binding universal stress UspA family protein